MTNAQKDLLAYVMNRKFQKVPVVAMSSLDQPLVTKLSRLVIELNETLALHNLDVDSQPEKTPIIREDD